MKNDKWCIRTIPEDCKGIFIVHNEVIAEELKKIAGLVTLHPGSVKTDDEYLWIGYKPNEEYRSQMSKEHRAEIDRALLSAKQILQNRECHC